MSRAGLAAAAAFALVLAGAPGCPRLPPLPPRPSARLLHIAFSPPGGGLARPARLEIDNRGERGLLLAAVDWELVAGGEPLLRGRAGFRRAMAPGERAVVDLPIAVPAALAARLCRAALDGTLRLRGTAHLESPSGGSGAPASFDDPARPSAPTSAGPAGPPPCQSTTPARQQPFEQ